jgi:hypothetical protein
VAWATFERTLRRLKEARGVYRRAYSRRCEEGGQYSVCSEWLRFEREEGRWVAGTCWQKHMYTGAQPLQTCPAIRKLWRQIIHPSQSIKSILLCMCCSHCAAPRAMFMLEAPAIRNLFVNAELVQLVALWLG